MAAPAGFGKTTLLADWASSRPERPAWLSCDSGDAEPVRFWTRLVAASAARWPGVGDDAIVLLERAGAESRDVAVALANDLAEVTDPVVVVDDLHLAGPSPSSLATFIETLAPNTRAVLGGRMAPPIPLARRRVTGHLLELHGDDLRFSEGESAGLLALNGITAEPDEMVRLQTLTEGWPAAVQLAALAMQRGTDRSGLLDAMASTGRATADFLIDEVLADLPDHWVRFLSDTCVLDRFDADLCVRMTGRDDAGAILHGLLDAGLFVVPLDDTGHWYRYHHLFGMCMKTRVRNQSASGYRHLHERAAAVLEERGLVVSALRHAFAYDDTARAAAIVRHTFTTQMHPADVKLSGAAVRTWLHERGEATIATDPQLVVELVAALVVTSASDGAARWLQRVSEAHPDAPPGLAAHLHGVWCEHHLARGRVDDARRHVQAAMDLFGGVPPLEGMVPLLYPLQTRAQLAAEDVDAARATVDAAIERTTGVPALDLVRLPALRAWIAYLDGDLERARRSADAVLEHADELDIGHHEPGRVYASLTLAGVHAERFDDDAAVEALRYARQSADLLARPPLQCLTALEHAAFARLLGDADTARAELATARVLVVLPSKAILARFDREAARQAVRFGARSAERLVAALDEDRPGLLLRARLALERQDERRATAVVANLPPATTRRQRVEDAVVRAQVAGDLETRIAQMELGLELGGPDRFVRTVVTAGPRVATVLAALPASAHTRYVQTLVEAAEAVNVTRSARPLALVDPLTPREIEILRHLSSRLTNHEMAAALHVSVNTLKTHLKSVYRKLGASSRAEAAAIGRGLHLL